MSLSFGVIKMSQSNRKPNTESSAYNSNDFVIWQNIKQINTAELVMVKAVSGKTVDVKPLLNSLAPDDAAVDSGIIYGIPFCKFQGGENAIDITPEVGDIGICVYCQRDISGVVSTGKQANPMSSRMFDCSDGVYVCSLSGFKTPSRYIRINNEGITIEGSEVPFIVNAKSAVINAETVNLGGANGQGVARIGDQVDLSTGLIIGGSQKVKAV